ncbi:hypothetical protein [Steroidobacter sp.]|uniref:hypothetical protein n=1 Tax=Steroidobacter sp. TaxID=1978227 RepID=UPI0039C94724
MTDVTFIHAEKIGFGAEARELALATARLKIAEAAARFADQSGEFHGAAPASG